jgi:pyridoxal phosphate enzyme (YggS family)
MVMETAFFAANLERIRERMALAAARCERGVEEITLIAVSKSFPADSIRVARAAGLRHFGESRVQEWEDKRAELGGMDAMWHFIGHLQSNKAKRAVQLFDRVDSVDSAGLAQKLNEAAAGEKNRLPVLIEVNLGGEATKSGVKEPELEALAEKVVAMPALELLGLMTIPPYAENTEEARPFFRRLREARGDLAEKMDWPLPVLSMGMSHDFEVAIEEGATEIRVGTALFGRRG